MRLRTYSNQELPTGPTETPAQAAAVESAKFQTGANVLQTAGVVADVISQRRALMARQDEVLRANEALSRIGVDLAAKEEEITKNATVDESGKTTYLYKDESFGSVADAMERATLDRLSEAQDSIADIADEDIRQQMQSKLQESVSEQYIARQTRLTAQHRATQVERYREMYLRAYLAGDFGSAETILAGGAESGVLNKDVIKFISAEAQDQQVSAIEQQWRGLYSESPEDAAAFYKALSESNLPTDLSDAALARIDKVREREEKAMNRMSAEAEAEQARRAAIIESQAIVAANRGQLTYSDVDTLLDKGLISPKAWERVTLKIDDFNEKGITRANANAVVSAALQGGFTLDASDKDLRAAIDDRFIQDVSNGVPVQDAAVRYAALGILPKPAQSILNGAIGSENPDQAGQAGLMFRSLKQQAPQGLRDLTADQEAYWNAWDMGYEMSGDFSEALSIARRNTIELTDAEKQSRKNTYNREKYAAANAKALPGLVDDWTATGWRDLLGVGADIPDRMIDDFEALTSTFFMATGNHDKAMADANEALRRTWGVNRIDGAPRLQKWSPLAVYRGSLPTDVQESIDLEDALADDWQKSVAGLEGSPIMVADTDTDNSRGGSWAVVNAETHDAYTDESGQPLRWRFDVSDYMRRQAAKLEKEAEQAGRFVGRGFSLDIGRSTPEEPNIYGPSIPERIRLKRVAKTRQAELLRRKADAAD